MLLKMLLPYYDRSVQGGVIRAWHKKEGEWVNYGDALFDLEINKLRHIRTMQSGQRQVELMPSPGALGRLQGVKEMLLRPRDPGEGAYETIPAGIPMLVTSSDAGLLLRICAAVGEKRQVGDLVALLATEEQDAAPP